MIPIFIFSYSLDCCECPRERRRAFQLQGLLEEQEGAPDSPAGVSAESTAAKTAHLWKYFFFFLVYVGEKKNTTRYHGNQMILDNYVDLGLDGAHRNRAGAEKYP